MDGLGVSKERRDEHPCCVNYWRLDRHRPCGGIGFRKGRQPGRHLRSPRGAGQALATELRALGAEAEFVPADVRHEDAVRELVDQTVARFGRLDVAVNTAGTEGQPGPVIEQSADSYAATFDTNVLGTLLSMKHELRVMQAQGSGSIINISSTYGHLGARGASVYSA